MWFTFPSVIAYSPEPMVTAKNAVIEVFNASDTGLTSPLELRTAADTPLAVLRSNLDGVVPAFKANATEPRVLLRSGVYRSELLSNDSLLAGYRTAIEDATAARIAAQNAAGLVGAPADVAIATAVNNPDSQTRAAIVAVAGEAGEGGGSGGGAYGVFAVVQSGGAWEFGSLAAAQTAGLRADQVLMFVGTISPPAWAANHVRQPYVYFTG